MTFQKLTMSLALAGLAASATPSFAVTGAGGPDLPEYARALGTIENGPGSTGMTVEEAQRIIAREQPGYAATAAAPVRHSRRHRAVQPDQ